MTMIRKDKLMTDPEDVFKTPRDVLENEELSDEQKIVVLEQWQDETKQRMVAEEEAMPGEDPNDAELLQEIHEALTTLRTG